MPRPNKPRRVLSEDHVAQRIAMERDRRGWTNDGLAKRMTDAGCPMVGSAIFKIEKGSPRRRIVVDELVAFAGVFGLKVEELLVPPAIARRDELVKLVLAWDSAADEASEAIAARDAAWEAMKAYLAANPEAEAELAEVFAAWAQFYFPDDPDGYMEAKMWRLTRSERWGDALRKSMEGIGNG